MLCIFELWCNFKPFIILFFLAIFSSVELGNFEFCISLDSGCCTVGLTFLFQGAKDSVGVAQSSGTQQLPPTYSAAIDQHKPPSYTPPKAAAAADAEKAATSSSQK